MKEDFFLNFFFMQNLTESPYTSPGDSIPPGGPNNTWRRFLQNSFDMMTFSVDERKECLLFKRDF